MRAISLWQPWASAMALGSKRIETRHWATDYRGPLVIHAAKRFILREASQIALSPLWQGALWDTQLGEGKINWPLGALVAVGTLVDCRPTESFTPSEIDKPRAPKCENYWSYIWTERAMGDYSPGRFGWVFENIRPLKEPVPFVGKQNFFQVPDELIVF